MGYLYSPRKTNGLDEDEILRRSLRYTPLSGIDRVQRQIPGIQPLPARTAFNQVVGEGTMGSLSKAVPWVRLGTTALKLGGTIYGGVQRHKALKGESRRLESMIKQGNPIITAQTDKALRRTSASKRRALQGTSGLGSAARVRTRADIEGKYGQTVADIQGVESAQQGVYRRGLQARKARVDSMRDTVLGDTVKESLGVVAEGATGYLGDKMQLASMEEKRELAREGLGLQREQLALQRYGAEALRDYREEELGLRERGVGLQEESLGLQKRGAEELTRHRKVTEEQRGEQIDIQRERLEEDIKGREEEATFRESELAYKKDRLEYLKNKSEQHQKYLHDKLGADKTRELNSVIDTSVLDLGPVLFDKKNRLRKDVDVMDTIDQTAINIARMNGIEDEDVIESIADLLEVRLIGIIEKEEEE